MKTLLMFGLLTPLVIAQPKAAVNGRPIDDKVFAAPDRQTAEDRFLAAYDRAPTRADRAAVDAVAQGIRCSALVYNVELTLRDDQMKQLGVSLTDADIERVRPSMESPAQAFKRLRHSYLAMQEALDAVDKGEDSTAVYERLLKAVMPPDRWEKMRNDEDTRREVKRAASETLDHYVQQHPEAYEEYKLSVVAEAKRAKRFHAVAEQLALSDRTLATYLANAKRTTGG